jgi:hypothetical protein
MVVDFPDHVLTFLQERHPPGEVAVEEAKSAQQKVWILTLVHHHPVQQQWSQSLLTGRNRLVVRQWRGSARWWNLNNSNEASPEDVARAEVAAYRLSYKALPHLAMPQLLHFDATNHEYPWAIFSYVGEHSTHFDDRRKYTMEWVDSMVKVRHEFGFDEPHPRWGRVPVEQAVEYTLKVLRTVTIPLHQHLANNPSQEWYDLTNNGHATTYADMVLLYEESHSRITERLRNSDSNDKKLQKVTDILGKCIARLSTEASTIKPLSPVLVHIDCQPQNLLFCRSDGEHTFISSILDWEEAAYADPRFELLLLCRKVCANREQADIVWKTYEEECQPLGQIEPWLRLETVHSVTTLVLQSMDLLGGGRSPWETKPDLLDKIEREFHRLIGLSWLFCTDVVAQRRV